MMTEPAKIYRPVTYEERCEELYQADLRENALVQQIESLTKQIEVLADVLQEVRAFLLHNALAAWADPIQERIATSLRSVGRSV